MFSGHVEIVSVFFMEHPISFSVMVTMKKNPSKTNFTRNKKSFCQLFYMFQTLSVFSIDSSKICCSCMKKLPCTCSLVWSAKSTKQTNDVHKIMSLFYNSGCLFRQHDTEWKHILYYITCCIIQYLTLFYFSILCVCICFKASNACSAKLTKNLCEKPMYKACKLKPFPANVVILQPLKNMFFGVLRA